MVIACQIVLGVSRRGCQFMLSTLQYIVQLALMRVTPNLSPREQKLMSDFPVDPRSATAQFHLDGKSVVYAVCPNPKCHCTYKPAFEGDSPIPQYPRFCNHRQFSNGPRCKEPLTKPRVVVGVEIQVPIKTFVSFDFKDWVAGLTSRPGFEEQMDSAWKGGAPDRKSPDDMHDIFDGEFIRQFQGPDGRHFGLGGKEGRYAFSLCVDFFNPYTNKQAGKKASIGIISLVCLNLPPDLRYKPENMFLAGIIPGPHPPPLTALNHYLTPLVDDFLDFWVPGVRFSCTHLYPTGRLVRCALVAVICDLPAARHVGGFAGHSHNYFCSVCHCTRAEHGYGNINYHTWMRRTDADCRSSAAQYNAANDEKARQASFDGSGVRWSELLRLPYFDMARCIVVDAMHNLFLGLIKEHFDGILGIRLLKAEEGPVLKIKFSTSQEQLTPQEQKSVSRLQKWLEGPLAAELVANYQQVQKKFMRCHVRALEFACTELKCHRGSFSLRRQKIPKSEWVHALLAWVRALSIFMYFSHLSPIAQSAA
jgi:Transposase family tnp2